MGVYIPIKDYSAMQGPCADGYHVPLKDEWDNLYGILTNTFGLPSNTSTFKTYLKMPLAGYRDNNGSVTYQGSIGCYWASTYSNTTWTWAYYFNIEERDGYTGVRAAGQTAYGYSIRPFKDTPVEPDNTWTTLYDGSSTAPGAGVFRNSSLGIMSISGDGNTWITIADKNLGAKVTYGGNAAVSTNSGNYYQWGNNYGFPFTGSVTTSGTQVDATNYGPGNYYSSSTFITRSTTPFGWDSSTNQNLWGGVTGVKPMSELKNAYIGEYIDPGIYHNATLGLISLSSDGQNWITIADKNLGATQVWDSGNALSQANCGNYYQWGNNYGFPRTGSVTTSSTQVDASNYGPGNYYSSSTFITYSGRWDTTDNGNLWGGVTGTNEAMQGPCPDGFHVPLNTEWQSVKDIWTALGRGNTDGANFGITLKLPFAGYRYRSSSIYGQGTIGYYWSSSRYSADSAYCIYFLSTSLYPQESQNRANGFPVRPFKNEAVKPGGSWTKLY